MNRRDVEDALRIATDEMSLAELRRIQGHLQPEKGDSPAVGRIKQLFRRLSSLTGFQFGGPSFTPV